MASTQGTGGLSENNIHLYLGSIELKCDEYLARWRRIHGVCLGLSRRAHLGVKRNDGVCGIWRGCKRLHVKSA